MGTLRPKYLLYGYMESLGWGFRFRVSLSHYDGEGVVETGDLGPV